MLHTSSGILQPGNLEDSYEDLDNFFNLANSNENSQIFFTPGDLDWDNSGRDGLNMVRKLEKQVEKFQEESNMFMPSKGCPGPEIVDLSSHLRLILINTQWWLHDPNCGQAGP